MRAEAAGKPTFFQRFLLPALAFKAVVIGGGYATGREIAEFFLPSGPWGGLAAMLVAMLLFSAICILTFLFAMAVRAFDYQSFFDRLLGPAWPLFELVYLLFVVLILAVYGAAAGEIAQSAFGVPGIVGTLALGAGIALFVTFGNKSVERLFEWVSYLLYGVYALFVVLALSLFGDRIAAAFAAPASSEGWASGGAIYASYNIIGAIVILPVVRHLTSRRDAVVAGAICGPLTMLPAALFFIPMVAFLPEVAAAPLPSDHVLGQMGLPLFHFLFQVMIFSALLESGASAVHAVNERIDKAWERRSGGKLSPTARLVIAAGLLVFCMVLAGQFGIVALIASGYRFLAYLMIAVFILPLLILGLPRILRTAPTGDDHEAPAQAR